MARPKTLKARLKSGERAAGCWLSLCSPMAAEIVAQSGYDCVMIDMEHGQGTVLNSISLMQATKGENCVALARVPWNDMVVIKRTLDAGAEGVMIPAVNSKAEAEAAVAACTYPPQGLRGVAPTVVRASRYGAEWQDYAARANEDTLVICQIESALALESVEEIAAVDGVDMLFIGPFDLSASMGHLGQPDHPEVRREIDRVEAVAKGCGKLLGAIPTGERDAASLYRDGYDLVLADGDLGLLRDSALASVAALRKAKGV